MKFSKDEIELLAKVKKALLYDRDGDPIKDVIEDDEIIEALRLLMKLAKGAK